MSGTPDFDAVFEASPIPCLVRDRELRVVAVNQACVDVSGRRREELLGAGPDSAFPVDPRDADDESARRLLASLEGVLASGERDVVPLVVQRGPVDREDGARAHRRWSAVHTPILDGAGRVEFVVAHLLDPTERDAQAELDAIFESFPEALFVGDASGVKRANAAACDVLGYDSLDQVLRRQPTLVAELLPRRAESGAPLAAADTPFANALRGQASRMEVVIRHRRTREDRYVFSSAAPIRIGGDVVGAVVTQIDVTEQKRAETEARKLAKVLDSTRDFVGISDLAGRPTFVNRAALELMGFDDLDAARALPVVEYFVERQRARVLEEVLPAALAGGYWSGELLFLHRRTGAELPVLYTVFPLRDGAGNALALATITRDLRAQKAAEAERAELLQKEQAARAEAEQANRLKDQFLATVSHELRTPLTAILGWMRMLRSGTLPEERRAHVLETIERNARVQAQLIEDLLDVSRIVSGKLALDLEPLDVAAVVGAAIDTVQPEAERKGIRLEVHIESSAGLLGDFRRLQQVIWNLLSNALKFTPSGGRVLLSVERRDDAIEIAVIDDGAGISPEFLPLVFERFSQADSGKARKLGGLGLGLSIVRHVVEAHGGTVGAFSAGEGRGATFSVRLPVALARAKLTPRFGVLSAAPMDGLRVLVVTDGAEVREALCALLEQCRAEVSLASNTADALSLIEHERPDVVIAELELPDEDGFAFIRRVRALPAARGGATPAIALASPGRPEERTRALLAGFQNHANTPIEPNEVLAVITALAVRTER